MELRRADRPGTRLTLVYVDLNGFKSINDQAGHQAGDRVLRDVATYLGSVLRHQMDSVFRIGGDEFAVIFLGASSEESLLVLSGRRRAAVRGPSLFQFNVSISVGAVTQQRTESAQDLVKRADDLMYQAKRNLPPKPRLIHSVELI